MDSKSHQARDLWHSYTHRMVRFGHPVLKLIAEYIDTVIRDNGKKKHIKFASCCNTFADHYTNKTKGKHKQEYELTINEIRVVGPFTIKVLLELLTDQSFTNDSSAMVPGYGLLCQDYGLLEVLSLSKSHFANLSISKLTVVTVPTQIINTASEIDPDQNQREDTPQKREMPKRQRSTPMKREDHINLEYIRTKQSNPKFKKVNG